MKTAINGELDLPSAETAAIGETLRQGMNLDRVIAQRLLTFLARARPAE